LLGGCAKQIGDVGGECLKHMRYMAPGGGNKQQKSQ